MLKGKAKISLIVAPLLVLALSVSPCYAQQKHDQVSESPQPTVFLPKTSLGPDDLAVIVNDADPLSIRIAQYYQAKRGIPDSNMIHVRF